MRIDDDPAGKLYDKSCIDISEEGGSGLYTELASCCQEWDLRSNSSPKGSQDPKGVDACIKLSNRASGEVYVRDGEPSYASLVGHSTRWSTALAATMG